MTYGDPRDLRKRCLRPLDALEGLPEQTEVELRIAPVSFDEPTLSDFVGIWTGEEADEIAAIIEDEFEKIDPREW